MVFEERANTFLSQFRTPAIPLAFSRISKKDSAAATRTLPAAAFACTASQPSLVARPSSFACTKTGAHPFHVGFSTVNLLAHGSSAAPAASHPEPSAAAPDPRDQPPRCIYNRCNHF